MFGGPEGIAHKYEVIREHCAAVGRDPEEIERSTLQNVNLARYSPAQVVDHFGELADAGAQHVVLSLADVIDPKNLETVGREILPQIRGL